MTLAAPCTVYQFIIESLDLNGENYFFFSFPFQKGFPLDCGIDELEEFFQKFGAVDTIFMRRLPKEKTFKVFNMLLSIV